MGHTNSTVNYNLPQFVRTDKPSWLGDVNGAFLAIDTAIAAAKTQADSAAGGVAGLQTVVGGHTTQIGTLNDTVTAQGGTLNSVTALIGNGTPTTTDQTIIGAINELNADFGGILHTEVVASESLEVNISDSNTVSGATRYSKIPAPTVTGYTLIAGLVDSVSASGTGKIVTTFNESNGILFYATDICTITFSVKWFYVRNNVID